MDSFNTPKNRSMMSGRYLFVSLFHLTRHIEKGMRMEQAEVTKKENEDIGYPFSGEAGGHASGQRMASSRIRAGSTVAAVVPATIGSRSFPSASAATKTLQMFPSAFCPKYMRKLVALGTASKARTEFLSKVSASGKLGVRISLSGL